MATILAYTSPALGHVLPISALLSELSRRGHAVHLRTLSAGVEIGQRLGFATDAIDSRIEAIEHDDWKASNPPCRAEACLRGVRPARAARSRRPRGRDCARPPRRIARRRDVLGCVVGRRSRRHPVGLFFALHAAAARRRDAAVRPRLETVAEHARTRSRRRCPAMVSGPVNSGLPPSMRFARGCICRASVRWTSFGVARR